MPMLSGSYDVAMRLLRLASPALSRGSSKLSAGFRGREHALESLRAWTRAGRDPSNPLIWMHAPSVGEGLQAQAVLEALREHHPTLQSVFTHFSPSAEGFARALPVDVATFLPWDVRSDLRELLAEMKPRLVSFTKTEVWPGLTTAAADRQVPVILCAATLSLDSARLRPIARRLLRSTFRSLSRVLAIAEEDGERFLQLGVPKDRIEVTGDPAIDSAWIRARAADPQAPYLAPILEDPRPALVAGSTWEADEEVLVPVIADLREDVPDLRVVLAPHEPDPEHLARLARRLRAQGHRTCSLADLMTRSDAAGADVVLVDRVGVLAHLYTAGWAAYVGGGFHKAGLHSVLEPAAAGIPILFGPMYHRSRAAADLIELGGARSVAGPSELAEALRRWLKDRSRASEIGENARGYVERHRGAAARTARVMESSLE
jgi:3-deoxy-D-manno-octulosonic-acid transferase